MWVHIQYIQWSKLMYIKNTQIFKIIHKKGYNSFSKEANHPGIANIRISLITCPLHHTWLANRRPVFTEVFFWWTWSALGPIMIMRIWYIMTEQKLWQILFPHCTVWAPDSTAMSHAAKSLVNVPRATVYIQTSVAAGALFYSWKHQISSNRALRYHISTVKWMKTSLSLFGELKLQDLISK